MYGLLEALERVEVGVAHAEEAVGVDQLQHRDLLVLTRRARRRMRRGQPCGFFASWTNDSTTGACATSLRAASLLQLVEVRAPVGADRVRIAEVALVQLLDERRIAAEEVRVAEEFLHHASCLHLYRGANLPRSQAAGSQRFAIGTTSRCAAPV